MPMSHAAASYTVIAAGRRRKQAEEKQRIEQERKKKQRPKVINTHPTQPKYFDEDLYQLALHSSNHLQKESKLEAAVKTNNINDLINVIKKEELITIEKYKNLLTFAKTKEMQTCLLQGLIHSADLQFDIKTILFAFNTDTSITNFEGLSLLHVILASYHYPHQRDELHQAEKFLLENKANPNERDPHSGRTPLHVAARSNEILFIKELLDAKADINAQDQKGCTPLHYVTQNNYFNLPYLQLFLQSGADLFAIDKNNNRPIDIVRDARTNHFLLGQMLCIAVEKNDAILTKNLLLENASVEAVDFNKQTPLHIAASKNNLDIIKLLLNAEADATIQFAANRTPLDLATDENARLLLSEATLKARIKKYRDHEQYLANNPTCFLKKCCASSAPKKVRAANALLSGQGKQEYATLFAKDPELKEMNDTLTQLQSELVKFK